MRSHMLNIGAWAVRLSGALQRWPVTSGTALFLALAFCCYTLGTRMLADRAWAVERKCLIASINTSLDTLNFVQDLFREQNIFLCQAEAAVRIAYVRQKQGLEPLCERGTLFARSQQSTERLLQQMTPGSRVAHITRAVDASRTGTYTCPWPSTRAHVNAYKATRLRIPIEGTYVDKIDNMTLYEVTYPPWYKRLLAWRP
jgi:hypothetical protein